MAIRQNSIDCYNQIKNKGLLSKRRLEVYNALFNIGRPSTTQEIFSKLHHLRLEQTRLSELRERGVIYERQIRTCTISGHLAIEWDLTDKLPKKLDKKNKPTNARAQKALKALRNLYKNKHSDDEWVKVAELIKSL